MYSALASAILLVHAIFVAFVVFTLPCIFLGKVFRWRWVRLYWLRILHLIGICIVAAQAWAGVICPLTTLEMWLREQDGLTTYAGSFVAHWLQTLIYWDLPSWVFTAAYSLFALLVISAWYFVPPIRGNKASSTY